jgi:hypothetical protein
MRLQELIGSKVKDNTSSITESREQIQIEDMLHSIFMKQPYFQYVRMYGPEKVVLAMEYVAVQHENDPDMSKIQDWADEVVSILAGNERMDRRQTPR